MFFSRLSLRKLSNLAVRELICGRRVGERGGEGGMEVSGLGGRVRPWIRARLVE